MKAPITQEEIDYRADLSNKVNAISSIQGLFTDIEDKPRRLRILKALLTALNYGDALNAEIDAEIAALEEAAAEAEEETAEGEDSGGSVDTAADTGGGDTGETEDTGDIDLGSLASLESFNTGTGDLLLEDQELEKPAELDILTEDDLPNPTELDSEKDFSENN